MVLLRPEKKKFRVGKLLLKQGGWSDKSDLRSGKMEGHGEPYKWPKINRYLAILCDLVGMVG